MTTTCSVYIATSLDGYIAKADGNIDWLDDPDYALDGEDFGFYSFFDSIDALIMGRSTYEKVLSFGEWPYSKPVIVLTTKILEIPDHLQGKVRFLSGSPSSILEELNTDDLHHFYIDGGKTIHQFLKQGLINTLIITTIPILLGDGISLFNVMDSALKVKAIESTLFDNGFVKTTYEVLNH